MDTVRDRSSGADDRPVDASRYTAVIEVADVEPATQPLADLPYRVALEAGFDLPFSSSAEETTPIEACADEGGRLIPAARAHAGVAAVHFAFADHRPLVLSPDIIWLFLARGFAQHVNANAETLRRRFVHHAGQIDLDVRRDNFIKGSPYNDWAGVFAEFSGLIREHIGETTHALLEPRFSTTGAVERAAAQVVLLGAMQRYFRYIVTTLCGIPRVLLEGSAADWMSLVERAEGLREFDLEWWIDPLLPILGKFVDAARGATDREFWNAIYKRADGSGGPFISGWITAFFPYLREPRSGRETMRNRLLDDGGAALQALLSGQPARYRGTTNEFIPSGLAPVPFEWRYLGDCYDMQFVAGFVGVRQDVQTLAVRPEIGWAVYEPAQIESVRTVRAGEGALAARAAADRAFERASAWIWKALCARCGEWIYRYQDDPPRSHCGQPLVQVSRRQ